MVSCGGEWLQVIVSGGRCGIQKKVIGGEGEL